MKNQFFSCGTLRRQTRALFEALDQRILFSGGAGSFDPTFGLPGRLVLQHRDIANIVGVASLANGEFIAVGNGSDSGGSDIELLKLTATGALDTSFGFGGIETFGGNFIDTATAMTLQSDGKIVVAGNESGKFLVARFNTDGTFDTTFGNSGETNIPFEFSAAANAVAIDGSGNIVVAGSVNDDGDGSDFAVARLTPDGLLDSTFQATGTFTYDFAGGESFADAVAFQGNDILIGGSVDVGSPGNSDFGIVRVDSHGVQDSSFGFSGLATVNVGLNDNVTGMVVDPNTQQVDFVGTSGSVAFIGAFDANGNQIADFGGSQSSSFEYSAIARGSDGSLYVTGARNVPNGGFAVTKFTAAGMSDTTFGTFGVVNATFAGEGSPEAISVGQDNSIFIGGTVGIGDQGFAHILPTAVPDPAFGLPGRQLVSASSVNAFDIANAVAFSGDKTIVAGGLTIDSVEHFGVAQFNSDGSLDTTFGNNNNGQVILFGDDNQEILNAIAVQIDGKIVVAGSGHNGDFEIFRLNPDGSMDSSFGDGGEVTYDFSDNGEFDNATSIVIQSDGDIVVGGSTKANADDGDGTDFGLIRLLPDGWLDSSFGDNGQVTTDFFQGQDDFIRALAISGTKIIALGSSDGSNNAFVIAQYNPDGSLDSSFSGGGILVQTFGADPDPVGLAVLPDGDIAYAGEYFNGNNNTDFVSEVTSTGQADTAFGVDGVVTPFNDSQFSVNSFAVGSDGKLYLGGEEFLSVRLTSGGSIDTTWGLGGIAGASPLAFTDPALSDSNAFAAGFDSSGRLILAGDAQNESSHGGIALVALTTTGQSAFPDLALTNISLTSTTVAQNGTLGITPSAINLGNADAGEFTVSYYISTSGTFDNTAELLGSANFSGLAAGSSMLLPTSPTFFFIPSDLTAGTYNVFGFIDSSNTVAESNENNNIFLGSSTLTITAAQGQPNVLINGISFSSFFAIGDNFSVTPIVENAGSGASGPFTISYFLSPTPTLNSNTATLLVIGHYSSLAANTSPASLTPAASALIPTSITPGVYYLIGISSLGDTQASASFTITPATPPPNEPDLFFSGVSFTSGSYSAGMPFTFTPSVGNDGAADSGPFTVQTDLSLDSIFGNADDIILNTIQVTNVAAGATDNLGAQTVTLPAGLATGGYRLISRIDPANTVTETDKTNDTSTSADSALTFLAVSKITPKTGVGSLNPNFGNNGIASTTFTNLLFNTVDAQGDSANRLVVAGYTTNTGDFFVSRFNTDGSLDTNFGTGGRTVLDLGRNTFDTATSLAIDPSTGDIYVAGYSQSATNPNDDDFAIARFTPNGLVDTTFGTGGVETIDLAPLRGVATSDDHANAIALSGTSIYLAGSSQIAGSNKDFALLRLTNSGVPDTSFSGDGLATVDFAKHDDVVNTLLVQSDGKVVLVGSAQDTTGKKTEIAAARITTSGVLDNSFGTAGKIMVLISPATSDNEAFTAGLLPGNKGIVLGGFYTQGSGNSLTSDFAVIMLNSKGNFNFAFGNNGQAVNGLKGIKGAAVVPIPGDSLASINQLVVQPNGNILLAGKGAASASAAAAGNIGVILARLTPTGQLDTNFNNTGILKLFTPSSTPAAPPTLDPQFRLFSAASGNLSSQFSSFSNAATGIVDLTPGGGILALASSQNTATNSTTVSVASVIADGIDLTATVTLVGVPATVLGGAKGAATLTITNKGSLTANGNIQVQLYLSSTQTVPAGSLPFKTFIVNLKNLKPKAKKLQPITFTFPNTLPTGNYFLLADINSAANPTVVEINYTNNVAASARKKVTQTSVDLADKFTGKIPGTIVHGKNANVNIQVSNHGTVAAKGKATVKLYAVPAKGSTTGEILLATLTKPINLAPHAAPVPFSLNALVKAGAVPPGTEFLAATVSFAGSPAETDLLDNTVFSSTSVTFQ
jgi:uncharacterized delta-60 repeat protein